jgi:hypothetical protein
MKLKEKNNQFLIRFSIRNCLIHFIHINIANDDSESMKKLLSKTMFSLIFS